MIDAAVIKTERNYERETSETQLLDARGKCLTYKIDNTEEFRKSVTKKVLLLKSKKKGFNLKYTENLFGCI
jgi:hypothetical protein